MVAMAHRWHFLTSVGNKRILAATTLPELEPPRRRRGGGEAMDVGIRREVSRHFPTTALPSRSRCSAMELVGAATTISPQVCAEMSV